MRAGLAIVFALVLLAVLGGSAVTVSGAGSEAELRIAARRLDDGRLEFALQQRRADGNWGRRTLPTVRFFPAAAPPGRWLVSTPLTVDASGADGGEPVSVEVRIVAQRLADGRTEFGLQQRRAGSGWSERLLPRARFVPATSTVGRWLVSTPLMVGAEPPGATAEPVAPDRAVLVAFYEATGGARWHDSTNWLTDRPLGTWSGVTTDGDGRVTALHLSRNRVAGPIPPGLGALTRLEELDLAYNHLTGRARAAILPSNGAATLSPVPRWPPEGAVASLGRRPTPGPARSC